MIRSNQVKNSKKIKAPTSPRTSEENLTSGPRNGIRSKYDLILVVDV